MSGQKCGLQWLAGAAFCACLQTALAQAQTYPAKPIRLIVGFAAGGSADTAARLVGQKLYESLGQPLIVENRLGAGSSIANERVATAPADGYTLLQITASAAVLPAVQAKLPYDIERDFAPVSMLTTGAFVLVVHPSVPAGNVKELIALARARPGKMSYGSSGVGGSTHLAAMLFAQMAKLDMVHVPYKGSSESALATATGQIDLALPDTTSALPLLETGKLRALAVSSAQRSSLMPALPTMAESGVPGYARYPWNGVLAPVRIAPDIITRLNEAIVKAVHAPGMKEQFNRQGLEPQSSTPQQFAALIRSEIAQNIRLIKLSGAKTE